MNASTSFPGVQDFRYLEQYYQLQSQKDAVGIWSKCNSTTTKMPNLIFTTEESDKLATIKTNIDTCAEEWFFKFITGVVSLDQYDKFKSELVTYGVEDSIEIYQAAYDRYLKR